MSSLYRSAINARIAKLPDLVPSGEDLDEEDEANDSLASLPGGMGPPAM
jgi:protein phosphatase methylesterase 1